MQTNIGFVSNDMLLNFDTIIFFYFTMYILMTSLKSGEIK